MTHSPIAVCLASGGLDSAVTLTEAREAGFGVYASVEDYLVTCA